MRRLLLAALLLSGVSCTGACASRKAADASGADASGEATCRSRMPAPGEPLGSLRVTPFPLGEVRDLAEDKGSVVLLDVWATWCEPCRDTLPSYEAFARELGPRGLKVYALSVDEDPRQVTAFLEQHGLQLQVLLDRGAKLAECRLALRGVPTSFLVDRAGRVRYVHQGATEATLEETRRELEALLAEPTEG